MRIHLLTITHQTPAWIKAGYEAYHKRLPSSCGLNLIEIPAEKRSNNADLKRIMDREGEKMLAQIKADYHVIALDIQGAFWSTEELAKQLQEWQQRGRDVALLVGGPEGLAPACLKRAQQKWSLSRLTFPHFLVRIILAEQVYRAWSLLKGLPYHR